MQAVRHLRWVDDAENDPRELAMSVYKPCDIRGPVEELGAGLYRAWGYILAKGLETSATFLVGGDVRLSSGEFREAFLEGVRIAGGQAVDLGTLPTPMVYFAKRHLRAPACAIVTASHSPPEINGLKWMVGDLPPSEADVQRLREETEKGIFSEGRPGGTRETLNAEPAYRTWLRERWKDEGRSGQAVSPSSGADSTAVKKSVRVRGREIPEPGDVYWAGKTTLPTSGFTSADADASVRCKVILDPGNGCWAGRALEYLRDVFPGAEFLAIHDRVDGLFRERNPDSARPQHLRELAATVRRQQADVGIAFDGDGDRVAFVDGEGVVLTAEEGAWVLARSFGREWEGRTLVYDIKYSERIPRAAEELGGRSVAQRSGHAFIRTSMIERQALFGAEVSGHFFFGELEGGDDGLFTACRMLRLLDESGRSLADWRRDCPPIFTTADLRVEVEPQEGEEAIERIKREFDGYPQSFLDGVRVEFPEGWALVRKSVTAPELTFRFEGNSAGELEGIVAEFAGRLGDMGHRLQEKYAKEKADRS